MLPLYQRERRSFIDGEALPISYELVSSTNTRNKRRTIDVEEDGSTLSAYFLLEKLIKEDLAKSEDMNRAPHVRALYAKTTQKLPRIVANTHLSFIAIHLLTSNDYELFNYVSFREGSGTANSINGLSSKFLEPAKNVVYNYMKMHFKIEKIEVGDVEVVGGKFIIDVTKEAILAGYNLFKYMQDIQLAVFDLSGLDGIVKTHLANSSRKVEEVRKQLTLRDAPSWAGIFSQSSKKSPNSKTTERGTKAIDTLLECGLIHQCNYLPKNSGLWKASPAEILLSESLQIALYEYVRINVNQYEQLYEEWLYPSDLMTMTEPLIDHLISAPDIYAKYYHNYAPEKCTEFGLRIKKLERDGVIGKIEIDGKVKWKFINYHNPIDHEQNDNMNSYILNRIETCQLEEISSIEHGLKRKLTKLVKRNEVIISPSSSFMNIEPSPIPLCKSDKNLMDLIEITSSPAYPIDLLEPTGNTQVDIPIITSFFDDLSTYAKPASLFDDTEKQVNFNNVPATNSLTLSPILSLPIPTSAFSHTDSAASCNHLVNMDNDIPILQTSSEQHSPLA
ncbi:unnamed protein product [Rotaria sordida]|uniref:Uncharacterized protein n=1 Tax=Rotaria sordida TaxID=392033 RepID=A0A815LXF9_9BILA|nr:unnamed protein product [Rotaria sordida]